MNNSALLFRPKVRILLFRFLLVEPIKGPWLDSLGLHEQSKAHTLSFQPRTQENLNCLRTRSINTQKCDGHLRPAPVIRQCFRICWQHIDQVLTITHKLLKVLLAPDERKAVI